MLLYLAGQQAGVVEVVISPLINNFVLCCFFVPFTVTQVTPPSPPPSPPLYHHYATTMPPPTPLRQMKWSNWKELWSDLIVVTVVSREPVTVTSEGLGNWCNWSSNTITALTPTIPPPPHSDQVTGSPARVHRRLFLRKISDFNKKLFIPKF